MSLNIKIIPVTPYEQNATLLWDDASKEAVLVDVGGDVPILWAQIQELGLHLKEVWLTHGHLDHTGGVVELLKRADVPVLGPHREDLFLLESLPETTTAYAKHGFAFSPAFVPTRWLEEGEQVSLGEYVFDVLHIFGHTPGHIVFYCPAEKLLIAGDTLFKESVDAPIFRAATRKVCWTISAINCMCYPMVCAYCRGIAKRLLSVMKNSIILMCADNARRGCLKRVFRQLFD